MSPGSKRSSAARSLFWSTYVAMYSSRERSREVWAPMCQPSPILSALNQKSFKVNQFERRMLWGQLFSWVNQFGVENQQRGWISFKALYFSVVFTFTREKLFGKLPSAGRSCCSVLVYTSGCTYFTHLCSSSESFLWVKWLVKKIKFLVSVSTRGWHYGTDKANVFWKVTETGWL